MARKAIEVIPKKRGRPKTIDGRHPLIASRVTKKMIVAVEKWAASKGMSRSAAICHMIKRTLIFDKKSRWVCVSMR
jgi:hypothetical protein